MASSPSLLGRLSVVGAPPPPPGIPIDGILRRAARERTLPVVCRNLRIPCGMGPRILARQVMAAHQAGEILRRVEALPFKGVYLGHELYPSPALRDLGDVDLLVRATNVPAADAALRSLGYGPERDGAPAARSPGAFLNSALYYRGDSLPVHLHWGLSNASLPHFMYRIDEDEVWREARGGRMARHHLLVTLCEHAFKHSFDALVCLTDVELASRGVDWDRAAGAARRWGLERAVYYALVLLRDVMGVESPGLARVRVKSLGWAGRAFLGAARRRRGDGLSALGLLSLASGAGAKARFVREALAPPREARGGLRSKSPWRRLGRAAAIFWPGARG